MRGLDAYAVVIGASGVYAFSPCGSHFKDWDRLKHGVRPADAAYGFGVFGADVLQWR